MHVCVSTAKRGAAGLGTKTSLNYRLERTVDVQLRAQMQDKMSGIHIIGINRPARDRNRTEIDGTGATKAVSPECVSPGTPNLPRRIKYLILAAPKAAQSDFKQDNATPSTHFEQELIAAKCKRGTIR